VLCRVICKKKLAGGGGSSKASRSLASNGGRETAPTTSPPLPPLMDTTLAQLQAAMNTTATAGAGALQQVPCFSSFNNNIASNSNGNAAAAQPCYLPMATGGSHGMSYLDHGLLPELGGCFDPLNSDKKLLKAVLSQFGGDVVPSLQHEMAAATATSSTWMNHFYEI